MDLGHTDQPNDTLIFDKTERGWWIEYVSSFQEFYDSKAYPEQLYLRFADNIDVDKLEPIHWVTLACLIQFFYQRGHSIRVWNTNDKVYQRIFHDLKFRDYWAGRKNYTPTTDETVLNLWRIVDNEKESYANCLEEYFKKKFFEGKDISVIRLCIIEAFYNVSDHAEAGGNAFSFIQYDESRQRLSVAVADFGKGIVTTVRDFNPAITDAKQALEEAVKENFTVGSQKHNAGKGLDTILSNASILRIFSNEALLYKNGGRYSVRNISFAFHGTLLYWEIDLGELEDAEYKEFEW